MTTLHVRLLGELCVMYGDKPVVIRATRLQSLLTFLLLHRTTPLSRSQIAFPFWPDLSERQARNNSRQRFIGVMEDFVALLDRKRDYRAALGYAQHLQRQDKRATLSTRERNGL